MNRLYIIAIALLILGLTACSGDVDQTDENPDTTQDQSDSDDLQQDTSNYSDVEEAVEGQMISEEDSVEIGSMI